MEPSVEIITSLVAGVAGVVAIASIIGAIRSGVLKKLRFGAFEVVASPKEREEARAWVRAVSQDVQEEIPFETEQLALYCRQILSQSKISFWFSLVFAPLGFLVIIVAVFMYSPETTGTTMAQFAAGAIMDAIAALFFVQSRNAQQSMGEFFDKLRRDRNHLESRKLCENIENPNARDALRIQLALHYAEVPHGVAFSERAIGAMAPTSGPARN